MLNQYNGQWRAKCCFLRPFRIKTLRSFSLIPTLHKGRIRSSKKRSSGSPSAPQQVHERPRAASGSSDGLHCAVLTFRASLKHQWWSRTELWAQASLEGTRQQHKLGGRCTAHHPQTGSPVLPKVLFFFFNTSWNLWWRTSPTKEQTLVCPSPSALLCSSLWAGSTGGAL